MAAMASCLHRRAGKSRIGPRATVSRANTSVSHTDEVAKPGHAAPANLPSDCRFDTSAWLPSGRALDCGTFCHTDLTVKAALSQGGTDAWSHCRRPAGSAVRALLRLAKPSPPVPPTVIGSVEMYSHSRGRRAWGWTCERGGALTTRAGVQG